jgi:hypothetical protein
VHCKLVEATLSACNIDRHPNEKQAALQARSRGDRSTRDDTLGVEVVLVNCCRTQWRPHFRLRFGRTTNQN